MESTRSAFYILDADGYYLHADAEELASAGFNAIEFLGAHYTEVLGGHVLEFHDKAFKLALQGIISAPTFSHESHTSVVTYLPQRNAEGKIDRVVAISNHIPPAARDFLRSEDLPGIRVRRRKNRLHHDEPK